MEKRHSHSTQSRRNFLNFIDRLFIYGHVTEKIVVLFSSTFLGFIVGLYIGRTTTLKQLNTFRLESSQTAAHQTLVQQDREVTSSEGNLLKSPKTSKPQSGTQTELGHYYFTIQVQNVESQRESQTLEKYYKAQCETTFAEFNPVLSLYSVYCGKFYDYNQANEFIKKLNSPSKLIVRRYPASN